MKSFCYLGDTLNQSGNCFDSTTVRVSKAWNSFRELLPVLTNKNIYLRQRGYGYNSCVRSILLYASETWPLKIEDIHRLERNGNTIIQWICSVRLSERKSMDELRKMIYICKLTNQVRYNRLRWFGHLERMEDIWPNSIRSFAVERPVVRGGQKKRWIHNIYHDLLDLRLNRDIAKDQNMWRKRIKTIQHDVVQPQNMGNHGR